MTQTFLHPRRLKALKKQRDRQIAKAYAGETVTVTQFNEDGSVKSKKSVPVKFDLKTKRKKRKKTKKMSLYKN